MNSSKKSQQMYFGRKAHIGTDAESGLMHTVPDTLGKVSDVVEDARLLHGEEEYTFGEAGYQGTAKRPDAKADVTWNVAMKPNQRWILNKQNAVDAMIDKFEKIQSGIRAKVERPFRGLSRQFVFLKVHYCSFRKNNALLPTLFAVPNVWRVQGKMIEAPG
jgi:IS5 family transposase